MINISDIPNADLLKPKTDDLIVDDYLQGLSAREEINVLGGHCPIRLIYYYGY
jgi:hypothetical protein